MAEINVVKMKTQRLPLRLRFRYRLRRIMIGKKQRALEDAIHAEVERALFFGDRG